MARGDKIKASQISSNAQSWYQRLRQIETNIANGDVEWDHGIDYIVEDPNIAPGSRTSVDSINLFIDSLEQMRYNPYLGQDGYGKVNWNYSPSFVSEGDKITSSHTSEKINIMLEQMAKVCNNCNESYESVNSTTTGDSFSDGDGYVTGDNVMFGDGYSSQDGVNTYNGDACSGNSNEGTYTYGFTNNTDYNDCSDVNCSTCS